MEGTRQSCLRGPFFRSCPDTDASGAERPGRGRHEERAVVCPVLRESRRRAGLPSPLLPFAAGAPGFRPASQHTSGVASTETASYLALPRAHQDSAFMSTPWRTHQQHPAPARFCLNGTSYFFARARDVGTQSQRAEKEKVKKKK